MELLLQPSDDCGLVLFSRLLIWSDPGLQKALEIRCFLEMSADGALSSLTVPETWSRVRNSDPTVDGLNFGVNKRFSASLSMEEDTNHQA
uniref:Uncharacterized protein n=1 Tax=Sphaerodactylus townsendi TaxID=933632 RepID=A0ACB8F9G2_9SAUR